MGDYYKTDRKELNSLSLEKIENLYAQGYVLTRIPNLIQTRSLRIDLSLFSLTSENNRVLNKTQNLNLVEVTLPLLKNETNWAIIAKGKAFYKEKFKVVDFTANKFREILYQKNNQKFNLLLAYVSPAQPIKQNPDYQKPLGYSICFHTDNILHYCYPFYSLDTTTSNVGMGMMLKAIVWAKETQKKYIYLGSATRSADIYKLQFRGLEWWDGKAWQKDISQIKNLLIQASQPL